MTGGADVLWYCVSVATSPDGDFIDLANPAGADEADIRAACLEATETADVGAAGITALLGADGTSQTAVVVGTETSWTHDGLGGGDHDDDINTPDRDHEIELRYRLYAVTDQDGDASASSIGDRWDRWIARAASEVATGSTMRPANVPNPQAAAPGRVGNLKAVAYATELTNEELSAPGTGNQRLHFFWNHPDGFVVDTDDITNGDQPNWRVEVQRRVPRAEDHPMYTDWQFVPDGPLAAARHRLRDASVRCGFQ